MAASMPGSGRPIEPGLMSMAGVLAIMMPPVSVCHQLSWIGRPEHLLAPPHRLRVERLADAGDEAQLRESGTCAAISAPAFISMRIAVGAVYQTVTRSSCEDAVPALGVEFRLVDDARSRRAAAAR